MIFIKGVNMEFADKLKKIRKNKNFSQIKLAERIDITPNHFSRLETGKYQPSIAVLKKLAQELEVSIDYLVSEDDEEIPEIRIQNKSLLEKVKLIENLDEKDQEAIIRIIDSMLTKTKMKSLLEETTS